MSISQHRKLRERALKLTPNKAKILESVLYVIQYAQQRGYTFTQSSVVKSLFVADLHHLKKFGRPVTFDNYSAMKNGPVGTTAYNLIRPDAQQTFAGFGISEALWVTTPRPDLAPTAFQYTDVKRAPDLKKLSETDRDELEQAADLVSKLGFLGTRDFTHETAAYKNAWRPSGPKKSFPMNYRLLVPSQSDEELYELVETSRRS